MGSWGQNAHEKCVSTSAHVKGASVHTRKTDDRQKKLSFAHVSILDSCAVAKIHISVALSTTKFFTTTLLVTKGARYQLLKVQGILQ